MENEYITEYGGVKKEKESNKLNVGMQGMSVMRAEELQ